MNDRLMGVAAKLEASKQPQKGFDRSEKENYKPLYIIVCIIYILLD